jgi:hypothetical protein
MEHRVSRGRNALDARLAACRLKEQEQLRRAITQVLVLVRQPQRLTVRMPALPCIGRRLVGAGFIFGPDR